MAIKASVERAKQKAAEEAARAASMRPMGPMPFWKPKVGKNRIRVLPPWTEEGKNAYIWWREVWAHWGIGPDEDNKRNVSCPKKSPDSDESECPVCDEYDRLKATGDPADMEIAKQLRAKQRIYTNIVDLTDPVWAEADVEKMQLEGRDNLPEIGSPKIQVWSFGPQIFKALLDYYTEDLDMTDLEEGYNIVLTREGKDINTKYMVRLEQKPSSIPFGEDPSESLHNLDQIMPYRSAVAIQAIMDGIDPDEAEKIEGKTEPKKQIAAPVSEDETEESEPEEPKEDVEEPKVKAKASKGNGVSESWPPKDDDDCFEWDKITDEQIEDPLNEKFSDSTGSTLHIGCFGAARQRDDSEACQECPLFERCGARIEFLDAEAAKKASKKGPGKKGPGKKAAGKPSVGKKSSEKSDADKLQEEMEAAVLGKRS